MPAAHTSMRSPRALCVVMRSSTRPDMTSNLCTLLSEHPGARNEPRVGPLHLIPVVVQGSVAMAALRHGGPHVMLRRRACKWLRR